MTFTELVSGVSRRPSGLLLIALGVLAGSLISASAVSAQTLTTLVNFNGTNGSYPTAGLIADGNGNLYGTTLVGGSTGNGNVFEIAKSTGGYSATPTPLADFDGINNAIPTAGLAIDGNGNLFGTTDYGGSYGGGNVFEIAKTTSGYAALTTLVSFSGSDGEDPVGGVTVDTNGNLFGTTEYGGSRYGNAYEVVYSGGTYATTATSLVSFDGTNGWYPQAGLYVDGNGNLFGTTEYGGAGFGNVFEIAKTTSGYAAPVTLVSFDGTTAAYPYAGLIADANGNLFGTTSNGGVSDDGTVFEIAKTTSGYASTPTILVSFDGTHGANPNAGLIADSNGSLFGTTESGGASGNGTVFEVAKTSSGFAATPTVVISFDGTNNAEPLGGLIADANGNLFGTTAAGGSSGNGTVFEISGSGFMPPREFAGTPGDANCKGMTISALAHTYGGIAHAATSLGYASVADLQSTVTSYCSN